MELQVPYITVVRTTRGMLVLQDPTTKGMLELQDPTAKGMLELQDPTTRGMLELQDPTAKGMLVLHATTATSKVHNIGACTEQLLAVVLTSGTHH